MIEKREDLLPKYNKTEWIKCGWENEPDRVDFIHAGFSCFILRNQLGCWCGYVGVPENHPAYGKSENDVNISVHGDLTYAEKCSPPICHIPEKGMPENVWWLGFDTSHYKDFCPSITKYANHHETYRDMNYVIDETKSLAEQLEKMAN